MNIKELEKTILRHNKLYAIGRPEITDAEYDALVSELKYFEPTSSVLLEVGAPVSYGKKVVHEIPMGSLDKVKYDEESKYSDLYKWILNHVREKALDYVISPKIDGLAGEIIYRNGKLVASSSRGDGYIGQSLTDNVFQISSIPKDIEFKGELIIRGEFYIPRQSFKSLLEKGDYEDSAVLNERNICSGAMMSKNPTDTASKNIHFIAYRHWIDGKEPEDKFKSASKIEELTKGTHFGVMTRLQHVPLTLLHCDASESDVVFILDRMFQSRTELPYRIDGAVVEINNRTEKEAFGFSGKNPNGAVAFKFQTEQAIATLQNIEWQISKYGYLTPVGKTSPVVLCDTIVKSPTLHNIDFVEKMSISIGDDLVIEKSGDIIPHVVRVIHKKMSQNVNYPHLCPACGKATIREGAFIRCINPQCKAVIAGALSNWLEALEIDEPGDAVIKQLVECGLVKEIKDIYSVTEKQFSELKRSSENLGKRYYENIHRVKEVPLNVFLRGLPIRGIGSVTWDRIARDFKTLERVFSAQKSELFAVDEVGEETAYAIQDSLSTLGKIIFDLATIVKPLPYEPKKGCLNGKSFCFTGKISKPRKEFERLVEANGGQLKSVCQGLDYLIAGADATAKAEKAKKLGIEIINEQQFMEMIR